MINIFYHNVYEYSKFNAKLGLCKPEGLSKYNIKTRAAMNAKTSVFVICIEEIIYLLLYNFHDCTFKGGNYKRVWCSYQSLRPQQKIIENVKIFVLLHSRIDSTCLFYPLLKLKTSNLETFSVFFLTTYLLTFQLI